MTTMAEDDLLAIYSKDFSTDVHGQLSVVDILKESVAELVGRMPQNILMLMSSEEQEKIEEQIMLFSLALYNQGCQRNY